MTTMPNQTPQPPTAPPLADAGLNSDLTYLRGCAELERTNARRARSDALESEDPRACEMLARACEDEAAQLERIASRLDMIARLRSEDAVELEWVGRSVRVGYQFNKTECAVIAGLCDRVAPILRELAGREGVRGDE